MSEHGEGNVPLDPDVDVLLSRCKQLQAELSDFSDFLTSQNKAKDVDIRPFFSSVSSELRSLERSKQRVDQGGDLETIGHTLRSSNLPFYEAVWSTAKASRGLVTFSKRFYWDNPERLRIVNGVKPSPARTKRRCALVDIVTGNGEEWIKISTITETRLLFEKAKAGWEFGDSDDDDDEAGVKVMADGAAALSLDGGGGMDGADRPIEEEEDDRVELVKIADDLKRASCALRVRYKHPKVRFVLPKVHEGVSDIVDGILADIRATGAEVQTGAAHGSLNGNLGGGDGRGEIFQHLLPSTSPRLTSILNLDCTVLLALVSDLSHCAPSDLALPENVHPSLVHQITVEQVTPLLPQTLYPGINGHELVTSRESAVRMREIVAQIGTPVERRRAEILLAEGAAAAMSARDLRRELAELSLHEMPEDLALPVKILSEGIGVDDQNKGVMIAKVAAELTPINRSVFLLGWARGWTTVTSNRATARMVEAIVVQEMDVAEAAGREAVEGPVMWIVGVARSLVGKEGGRG